MYEDSFPTSVAHRWIFVFMQMHFSHVDIYGTTCTIYVFLMSLNSKKKWHWTGLLQHCHCCCSCRVCHNLTIWIGNNKERPCHVMFLLDIDWTFSTLLDFRNVSSLFSFWSLFSLIGQQKGISSHIYSYIILSALLVAISSLHRAKAGTGPQSVTGHNTHTLSIHSLTCN